MTWQKRQDVGLNVTHFQSKYGELPLDETLAMLSTDRPNAEQIEILIGGMETLVDVLGNVVMEIEYPPAFLKLS